ncbi:MULTISPECIES: DUF4085 family protein [Bacillus]|uniref:Uncharacterized protein n=2 Tax=Bacillus TaxID=1386 RepID=A0A0M4FMF5_9BACI|nr:MULTISPECIES: DUF4085 family protein [Bacillus]ALC83504.1 hypothetical protein AM592_19670 [Bacillus gobiensis]MBP1082477.1 hypothetical protein [Bacillus capparidis]
MKYFTIDWYKEMHVSGFLVFPETKEEWNESIEFWIAYKKNHKEDLKSRKNDLLKFLPETLPSPIHFIKNFKNPNGVNFIEKLDEDDELELLD